MRVCPTCGSRYEAIAQFCTRDGATLLVEGPAADPYVGTKILGQIRVVRAIGSGGMGTVYEGYDEAVHRRVAIKVLHRDLLSNRDVATRFQREAQIASQLDHPNLVRLILFGQLPDGGLYLLLEFLDGPTFARVIDEQGPLEPARVVKIVAQIADAVGFVHRKEIVHRDLKPENVILVEREGDKDFAKVLDFGIAKVLVDNNTMMTGSGLIFGTARYISPEGAQGEPVDQRSDVYSLGVIAYQALTGSTPFDAPEPMQLLLKHVQAVVPAMAAKLPAGRVVPERLERVVLRALSKSPSARYADAAAFASALRTALDASRDGAASIRPEPASNGPSRSVPTVLVASPETASRSPTASDAPRSAHTIVGNAALLEVTPEVRPDTEVARERTEPLRASVVEAASTAEPAVTRPVKKVAQRVEMSAVDAAVSGPAERATEASLDGDASGAQGGWRGGRSVSGASSALEGRAAPEEDEIHVPGLPRRRDPAQTRRTIALVLVTVAMTVGVGLAGLWGMGMFPSQRRAAVIANLIRDADEAFRADRLVHDVRGNDVEDLTDIVLRMQPGHPRALELRRVASMRLRNRAVELRNEGHPERGLPLLRSALVLVPEQPEVTELVALFEREARAAQMGVAPSVGDAGAPRRPAGDPVPRRGPLSVTGPGGGSAQTARGGQDAGAPVAFPDPQGAGGVTFVSGRDPTIDPVRTAVRDASAPSGASADPHASVGGPTGASSNEHAGGPAGGTSGTTTGTTEEGTEF
jgi:serine/threonine protein kinase